MDCLLISMDDISFDRRGELEWESEHGKEATDSFCGGILGLRPDIDLLMRIVKLPENFVQEFE